MPLILVLFALLIVFFVVFFFVIFKFGDVKSKSNVCLINKTAVVTGGSSGLGYQIVLKLASRGCKVIIADKIVNIDIKNSIINETDNSNIVLEYVDFGSFKSVRQFAEKLKKSEEKLDILVNNVGIGKCSDTPTEDGLNLTMQVNYYSTFLLTYLLVDLLKKSKQGRIIFTASVASFIHMMFSNTVTANDIKNPPSFLRIFDYANAKFCTVTSSRIFAEKLGKWNITSNAYHPGIAKTNIWNGAKIASVGIWETFIYYFVLHLLPSFFGITADKACQAAVEMAISKEFDNVTGTFFGKYFPNLMPRSANNTKRCYQIWQATEKIVGLKPEEILE